MFFRPRKIDYHTLLIEHMTTDNYHDVTGGVCYGIASMGLQAILLRDTATFDKRINKLASLPSYLVLQRIKSAKSEWKSILSTIKNQLMQFENHADYQQKHQQAVNRALQSLDEETKIFLSVESFFDGVALYQSPYLYNQVFKRGNEVKTQELLKCAPILLPDPLIQQGGVCQSGHFTGAYTRSELRGLLKSLRRQITNQKITFPIALVLCSHDHAFTVAYDPLDASWRMIEANSGPSMVLSEWSMAKHINELFSRNDMTIIDAKIFSTGNNEEAAKKMVSAWKMTPRYMQIHDVTTDKAQALDSSGATLLYVAAQNGRLGLVKKLLQNGAQINFSTYTCPPALFIAAHNGHLEVAKELLAHGASVHADYYYGVSPLSAAANRRHIEIVRLLLDHGANFYEIADNKYVLQMLHELQENERAKEHTKDRAYSP